MTEVTVSAKVGGEIQKLLADDGLQVKKGDTLAFINHSTADIELRQSEANATAAEAQYKLTIRGAREEDIMQADAMLKNAQDDVNRMEELITSNSITQKQLDDSRTKLIVAQQNYEKLKRGSRSEEIEAARARRDQALAQVDMIRKKISDSYVVAPLNGIVTKKVIEEGEIVFPNAALFRVSQLNKVHIMIYVNETELAHVKLGQSADVYIDAFPSKPFSGNVVYISPVAEFTPKNVQTKDDRTKLVFGVKIEVANPEQVLKPGMPADVVIRFTAESAQ